VEGEYVGLVELISRTSEYRWLQEEAENEVQLAKRMPTRVGSPGFGRGNKADNYLPLILYIKYSIIYHAVLNKHILHLP
jgi:hypothetical protein